MSISAAQHHEIQTMIDASSPDGLKDLKAKAEATLAHVNQHMGRLLTGDESRAADVAIEILVRIEAAENSGGWWFRTKRRMQLVQLYLGA